MQTDKLYKPRVVRQCENNIEDECGSEASDVEINDFKKADD